MSSPLSAFTAVPNPQMLAFMGTQSFIMMYQAGEGWQYGKRKQSALSNEEFNKQTPLSIMNRQRQELINALPSIQDSMNAMTPLVGKIVEQYGDFAKEILAAAPQAFKNATEDLNLPGFPFAFGAGNTSPPPNTDFADSLRAIAQWLTGGPLIKKVSDRDNPPTPNEFTETSEETIAANKLALGIIADDKAKALVLKNAEAVKKAAEELRVFKLQTAIDLQKNQTPTQNQHADWVENIQYPATLQMNKDFARFKSYQVGVNKLNRQHQTVASRQRYNALLTTYLNNFKRSRKKYQNILTLAKNLRNPITIKLLPSLLKFIPAIPNPRWI